MRRHIDGFDQLRGIFCALVVLWHTSGLDVLNKIGSLSYLVDLIYYNVCLLAVPIFFQMSFFLLYLKDSTWNYTLSKRLPNLLSIFFFWIFVGIILRYLLLGNYNWSFLTNASSLILWLMQGGSRPELYFLFSLIVLTIIAQLNYEFFKRTQYNIKYQYIFLIISSLLLYVYDLFSLIIPPKNIIINIFSSYWNPLGFLPYIFSSLLILEHTKLWENSNSKKIDKRLYLYFLVFIVLTILEWIILRNHKEIFQFNLPPYSRISLVIGSSLILYFAAITRSKPFKLWHLISIYSLGIYCIHFNFIYPINFFQEIWQYLFGNKLRLASNTLAFILVMVISWFLVKLLRKIKPLRRFT